LVKILTMIIYSLPRKLGYVHSHMIDRVISVAAKRARFLFHEGEKNWRACNCPQIEANSLNSSSTVIMRD